MIKKKVLPGLGKDDYCGYGLSPGEKRKADSRDIGIMAKEQKSGIKSGVELLLETDETVKREDCIDTEQSDNLKEEYKGVELYIQCYRKGCLNYLNGEGNSVGRCPAKKINI